MDGNSLLNSANFSEITPETYTLILDFAKPILLYGDVMIHID
jgi:hypothetical protein